MWIAHYTYSYEDKTANAGKIAKTVWRTIDTESKSYAEKLLYEYHKKKNQEIEIIYDLIEGI